MVLHRAQTTSEEAGAASRPAVLAALTSRRVGILLLPYLVLVVIHLLSGLQMEQPTVLADELGYLGNARYLSGAAHMPDMRQCQFYHFGYSLFLLPAFWLFTDPVAIYRAAIVINALLMSSLFFPLYFILRSHLEVANGAARWIAFACCLYPPLILYSNFAWAESAFIPLYAVTVAVLGNYLVSRSRRDALLFGALAGFLYTVHPRALPVLAVILVSLAVLVFLRLLPVSRALLSASAMALVFALTRSVNEHLKAIGWGGGGEFSAIKLAGRLLPDSDFPALVERAMGQLLYLSLASHGLFLLGLMAVIWLIVRKLSSESPRRVIADPQTAVPIFVSITAVGIFVASCTSKLYSLHGSESLRGAEFIYGRYNEGFAVLFIAFALAEFFRREVENRQLIWGAIGVTVVIVCLTAVVAVEVDDAQRRQVAGQQGEAPREEVLPSEVDGVNVPGVYPLVELFGGLKLPLISLVAIASFLLIAVTTRFSRPGGLALLIFAFALYSVSNYFHYLVPARVRARPRLGFVTQAARLGPISAVSYDAAHLEPEFLHGIQFLMQEAVFDRFDSRNGDKPESEVVISGNDWPQAESLGASFIVSAGGWNNALWVLPGETRSRLPAPVYEGVILGAAPGYRVRESGFHQPERIGGADGRWTNGAATLRVPVDPRSPPHLLGIETMVPDRDGADLRLLANGIELWHQEVPGLAWSKTFDLQQIPLDDELLIELESDVFTPAEDLGRPEDQRQLGVLVRAIRLASPSGLAGAASEGLTLGAEPVFGFEESGFLDQERLNGEPARWTDGSATLRVPLDPRKPPAALEIETAAPLRDEVELQVIANGIELWRGRIPPRLWSKTLSMEGVPLDDELLIELRSDTFVPAEAFERSADQRRLGVMVRGIRLKARE